MKRVALWLPPDEPLVEPLADVLIVGQLKAYLVTESAELLARRDHVALYVS